MRVEQLPPELVELVQRCVRASALTGAGREAVTRDLLAHVGDALETSRSVPEIIAEFGDPEMSGRLIGRVRRPATGLTRRVAVAIVTLGMTAAATIYASSALSLHRGSP